MPRWAHGVIHLHSAHRLHAFSRDRADWRRRTAFSPRSARTRRGDRAGGRCRPPTRVNAARVAPHHDHSVSEIGRLLKVVGHRHDREVGLGPKVEQVILQRRLGETVERAERLIRSRTDGLRTNARAIATRWAMPPDSALGQNSAAWEARPDQGARHPLRLDVGGEIEPPSRTCPAPGARGGGAAPGRRRQSRRRPLDTPAIDEDLPHPPGRAPPKSATGSISRSRWR